ncbi:MAG: hypothetical protein KGJ95_10300 [Candidatus Omnitrophica bacterium]|nr:hypothetical protein [Candidatus Omnitrophota bacterium]
MANPVLDFGSFTATEKTNLLASAKAEYLKRMTGRVAQGSSAAQSYGLNLMDTLDIIRLINGLTIELGLPAAETRVRPNFNQGPSPANSAANPLGYGF